MTELLQSENIPTGLREALRLSPRNPPLLTHTAELVLRNGHADTAELLFKESLALDSEQVPARIGLAQAFFAQGKHGAAAVIIENMVTKPNAVAEAFLLHARLAFGNDEHALAARQYAKACALKPAIRDGDLENALGSHLKFNAPSKKSGDTTPPMGAPSDEAAEEAPVTPIIRFADVGGMDRVKNDLRLKVVLPLQQPDLYRAYGKSLAGGTLLFGPPGCGKAILAKAVAGELSAHFISLNLQELHSRDAARCKSHIHAAFEEARAHGPCVLFFEDLDVLKTSRAGGSPSDGHQAAMQLIKEVSNATIADDHVVVLASTHVPWHLDTTLRQPGRFDRTLFVPPPDLPARRTILRLLLRGKPVAPIDWDVIARRTEGFSNVDLKAAVDVSIEARLKDALRSGLVEPITERDLIEAVKRHRPTVKDWFATARNYALYANQSGLYDEICAYLNLDC